jgi:hypothetical protein
LRVPETPSIELLIQNLGDSNAKKREDAAGILFGQGLESARQSFEKWLADAELKGLFALDRSALPVATVGVAVRDNQFERIRSANGSPPLSKVPADQDAKEFELHFGHEIRLDILTTRDPGGAGAIARFLEKFGEGIQQVEVLVRDVDRATEILATRFGQPPIYAATRPGADGTRVNFFLVTTPLGKKVLIEFVEEKQKQA